MGYKYLIIGAGVGKAIAWWLLQQEDTSAICIADIEPRQLEKVFSVLNIHDERITTELLSSNNEVKNDLAIVSILPNVDVIINAAPARFSPSFARHAIAAEKHFCDLGGVIHVTKDILGFDEDAQRAGISLVPDCGLMPGLGNLMAVFLLHLESEQVKSIVISSGAIPLKPKPPYNYQQVFSAEGLHHIAYDKAPVLHNGNIEFINPLESYSMINTPYFLRNRVPIDRMETFVSAGAALLPEYLQTKGVLHFKELTLRWPGFQALIRDTKEKTFEETVCKLAPTNMENPDIVYLSVEAKNTRGESTCIELIDSFDEKTGLSSIERTTGFPTAKLARMQARGELKAGANTFEQSLNIEQIYSYLHEIRNQIRFEFYSDE